MSRKVLHRGVVVQGFQIEKILGQGGFGITYLATELESMSLVAIKEYFPKSFASRTTGNTIRAVAGNENQRVFLVGLKGFLEEARVLARLDHPNVIKVKSFFKANGTAYFVMEYCEGESLQINSEFLKHTSLFNTLKIFDCVLSGLEHVHQFGIIHGDMKPANIFLKKNQEPVLLDFGSARHDLVSNFFQQVSDGYSPPELYEEKSRLGAWTDIYGIGATFYKLLTGIKPPSGNERIVKDTLKPCSEMSLGHDLRFLNLIDKCLSVDHKNRPKTVSEVRNLLKEIIRNPKANNQVKDFSQRSPSRPKEDVAKKFKSSSKKSSANSWMYALSGSVLLFVFLYFAINTKKADDVVEVKVPQPMPLIIGQECEINIFQQSLSRLCEVYHQGALPECRSDIEFRFKSDAVVLLPQSRCGTSLIKPVTPSTPIVPKPSSASTEIEYTAKLIKDSCTAPKYPDISRSLREEGKVSVRVLVGKDGAVLATTVIESSGSPRLDQAMRNAVSFCRFTPGAIDETSWAGVNYTFKLD